MKYIKRHLEDLVLSLSHRWSAILLTGPRQASKTSMLKELIIREGSGRGYVSLDDLSMRELAKTDPKMLLQLYPPPVLIDEVQYAPELFTYIKIHIDQHQKPGDFWLTASQVFSLMRGVQESLAGRVALLHMSPLSQREITAAESVPFMLNFDLLLQQSRKMEVVTAPELFTRLWNGSMPGLVSRDFQDRELFYSSYLST